jgi:C_GCAxxG_C_C family probable redox protein
MGSARIDEATACFMGGFNCAQAVCSAFAEQYGLDRKTALKVSGAFGGGMASTAETCGAVTGGLMVIGLKYGKCKPEDDEAKQRCQAKAQDFLARFRMKHSSLICRELLGCDISTPEGKLTHEVNQLKERKCKNFVADASEILEEIV